MERPNVSSIKKGQFVILESRPCKIDTAVHSKVGKHGHAKVNLGGSDCLEGKRYTQIFGGDPKIYRFVPSNRKLQLIRVVDDTGKNITVECFDEKAQPIILDINKFSQDKVNDIKKIISDVNRTVDVTVVTYPVPKTGTNVEGDCEFEDQCMIEAYVESD